MTTTTPTTGPVAEYDRARKALEALEAEQATIGERIHAAALEGKSPLELMTRQIALPTLIAQARRELAPLEVGYCEHELALVAEEAAEIEVRYQKAQEAVRAAERRRDAVADEVQRNAAIRRDLEHQRKVAWRRVQSYAAGGDPDAAPAPPPVVRSAWQFRGGDAA